MDTERKHLLKRLVALVVLSILVHPLGAAEFSKAGYWDAEGSPRRVETLTTGWEFSLDAFKTSKRVTLPHSIDEGEIGFEASGCVNRQQPAWYRRKFDWKRHGARHDGVENWSRVFDYGADNAHYFTLCWTYGTNLNKDRAGMKNPGEMTHYGLYRLAWADVRTRT